MFGQYALPFIYESIGDRKCRGFVVLTLSKRVEYGLMSILHVASLPEGEWATTKGIAERYAIPPELLGKVMQALAKAGLLASSPGVHGGYRLIQPLDRVNLGAVIEAVEGPVYLTNCQEDPERCGQFHACTIKEPIQHIHAQLVRYLHTISLNEFRIPTPVEPVK